MTLLNIKGYHIIKKHKFFNKRYYLDKNPSLKKTGMSPLLHYLFFGFKENKKPHQHFDTNYYMNHYTDVKENRVNPLVHFVLYGQYECRKISKNYSNIYLHDSRIVEYYNLIKNSAEFEEKWYLKNYPEVKKTKMDAISYYLRIGFIKCHDPSPYFNSNDYLKLNFPKRHDINPFVHYLKYGRSESRRKKYIFSDYIFDFLFKFLFHSKTYNFFKIILPTFKQVLFYSPWSKPNEKDVLHENSQAVYDQLDDKKVIFARKKLYSKDKVNLYFKILFSKVIVIDSGFFFLNQFKLREKQKVIQIWHACGAFKKIGYDLDFYSEKTLEGFDYQFPQYDNFIVSSENIRDLYASAHHMDKEKVNPLGVPRTDMILDEKKKKNELKGFYERNSFLKGKKIILYCPTFRDKRKFNPKIDWKRLNDSFDEDTIFIIKRHIETTNDILEKETYSKIIYLEDESTYTLMFASVIMITDYSSVIFEYSLLNKPVIHYCPDYDTYVDERDFYLDFNKDIYGEIVYTDEELVNSIKKTLDNPLTDDNQLLKFKDKFMGSCDGNSTRRVVNLIKKYLNS